jgi:hypothetical protein
LATTVPLLQGAPLAAATMTRSPISATTHLHVEHGLAPSV